jgi:hypothetical protein
MTISLVAPRSRAGGGTNEVDWQELRRRSYTKANVQHREFSAMRSAIIASMVKERSAASEPTSPSYGPFRTSPAAPHSLGLHLGRLG